MAASFLSARTRLGSAVDELVFGPIEHEGISPLVVDAGARNRLFLLPEAYTRRATLVGFEPNPAEYAKLVQGTTDAEAALGRLGVRLPAFKATRYHDTALWDSAGARTLYITRGPGACTLMGPVKPFMRDAFLQYPDGHAGRDTSAHDLHYEVIATETIRCQRLDAIIPETETVDFLKIDVEGAELRVLRGADGLLADGRALLIRSEFQVFSYYDEHPLLGDQQRFLADRGYRLIDLELEHHRYRRGRVDLPAASDRGMLMAGDAIFIRDPDSTTLSPMALHRLAAIALALDFTTLGVSLLRDAGLLSADELSAVAGALRRTTIKGWKGRLLERWANLPVAAYRMLRAVSGRS